MKILKGIMKMKLNKFTGSIKLSKASNCHTLNNNSSSTNGGLMGLILFLTHSLTLSLTHYIAKLFQAKRKYLLDELIVVVVAGAAAAFGYLITTTFP